MKEKLAVGTPDEKLTPKNLFVNKKRVHKVESP